MTDTAGWDTTAGLEAIPCDTGGCGEVTVFFSACTGAAMQQKTTAILNSTAAKPVILFRFCL
ncbi:MAG: hypothetical protein LKF71_01030 [Oscillospiraceae bacterium]|nr:hypothetical protein [Oscillospiraceae bacterium]